MAFTIMKRKRFIIFLSFFFLIFSSIKPQRALANPIAVVGGLEVTAEALTVLACGSLVAGGAIVDYANGTDAKLLKEFGQGLIDTGNAAQYVAVKLDSAGRQCLTWTQDGLNYLGNYASSLISKGTNISTSDENRISIGSTPQIVEATGKIENDVCTFLGNGSYMLVKIFNSNGTVLTQGSLKIDNGATCKISAMYTYNNGTDRTDISIMGTFTSVDSGISFHLPFLGADYRVASHPSISVVGASVCVPYTGGLNNFKVGSISADTVSVPIANKDNTAIPLPAVPVGKAWGDISSDYTFAPPVTGDIDVPITGDTTGTGTLNPTTGALSIPILGDILRILQKILEAIKSIPLLLQKILDFFKIDTAEIAKHTDYAPIIKSHFQPFYDISDILKDVQSSAQSHSGKFYMTIPREMGGDGQEHCVLDLTVGFVYIQIARNIIKYGIWICFMWFVIRTFSPKFNIGG